MQDMRRQHSVVEVKASRPEVARMVELLFGAVRVGTTQALSIVGLEGLGMEDVGWVLPPLSNSWVMIIVWVYIALSRTPNIDCYCKVSEALEPYT